MCIYIYISISIGIRQDGFTSVANPTLTLLCNHTSAFLLDFEIGIVACCTYVFIL